MPVTAGFIDNQLLFAANLNSNFAKTAAIAGDAFTGPVSIQGIDIGSGLTSVYNAANAAFTAANNSSGNFATAAYTQANLVFVLANNLTTNSSSMLNVLTYGADPKAVNDSTNAFINVINDSNTRANANLSSLIYIPAGVYEISNALPMFVRHSGAIKGDGANKTFINLSNTFTGDVFSWSESWIINGVSNTGPYLVGVSITGARANVVNPSIQNAIMLYDRNDLVHMDDIIIQYVMGRGLGMGIQKNISSAYVRESRFSNMRFFNCGCGNTIPVVEVTSNSSPGADATNEVRFNNIDIYGSYGPSFAIRNSGLGSATRDITIDKLRIEGQQPPYIVVDNAINDKLVGDLLSIGDYTFNGNVNTISVSNLELIDGYNGYNALNVIGGSTVLGGASYFINVSGNLLGGAPQGNGIRLDNVRNSNFRFDSLSVNVANAAIITTANTGTGILFEGQGVLQNHFSNVILFNTSSINSPIYYNGNVWSTATNAGSLTMYGGLNLNNIELGTGLISTSLTANAASTLANTTFATIANTLSFLRNTTGTYFDSTGTLQIAPINTIRINYNPSTNTSNGTLIESGKINYITNPLMFGANSITNTLPTGWTGLGTVGNITSSIINTGIEDGISFIDINVSGVSNASLNFGISAPGGAWANSAQTWSASVFGKLVSGSLINTSSFQASVNNLNAANGFISATGIGMGNLNNNNLSKNRYIVTYSPPANTNSLGFFPIQLFFPANVTINFVARIGDPQLEQGNSTSVILPPANTIAQSVRGADIIQVTAGGLELGTGLAQASANANAAFIAANNALAGNITGNIIFTKFTSYYSAQTTLGIGATGTINTTAISLNTQVNIVTVCSAAANSAILPIPPIGSELTIINQGATNLQLFPPAGHGIDSLQYNANTCVFSSGQYKILLANTNRWYTTSNTVINASA